VIPGKFDGSDHVGHTSTLHNDRGMAINQGVVDFARRLVARVAGAERRTAKISSELL
jgi:hypothetical protein